MTITKERLQEVIDGDILFTDEQRELARIALASLTAEPVAWMCEDEEGREYNSSNEFSCGRFGVPLYAAPPAPVVPEKLPCSVELKPSLIIGKGCKTETLLTALRRRADYYAKIDAFTPEERAEHDASIEAFKAMLPTPADSQGRPRAPVVPPAIEPDYKVIKSILPTANPDEYACCIAADMWNACRDAMLQDNQRDLSQPVDPQVAEYEQIMLQAGNSPVSPGGWALVPIVPTEDMVINGFESEPDPHFSDEKVWAEYEALSGCRRAARRAELCWAAMIKAAPKQEGNNR